MKIREVIDRVSSIYREERKKAMNLQIERDSILTSLEEVHESKGENISLMDYNTLLKQKDLIDEKFKMQSRYCDGIAYVREVLMDLGFYTEISI
jgi:hypothetical protein